MGLLRFGKSLLAQGAVASNAVPENKDVVAHYRRLRSIRLRLNDELVRRLSPDVIKEGAKRLGMLRGGTFVFDNEDETCVLMDYCIYDVYHKGRNAIEQYLCDSPPDPDSEEMACLHAMQRATYTMVAVLRVERGVGCLVRNLFTGETRFLVDIGFSKTARPGVTLLTRLLDFGNFVATTGAALPLGILSQSELDAWQRKLRAGVDGGPADHALLIRTCLQQGASSYIQYEGQETQRLSDAGQGASPVGISAKQRRALEKRHKRKPLANRRCKCGSGKMVKNCCKRGKVGEKEAC